MDNSIRIIGQCGKEGKGESQFAQPRGVCINSKTKEIFVVDCNNHRVQVFHLYSLAFVRQIGKGAQGNAPGSLTFPVGIDIGENYIYVADTNNHRVAVFNHLTGAYVRSIGSQGSSMGCLNCPYGVCVDTSTGQLFVADYENNRVQVFDSDTGAVIKVIGDGQGSGPGQFQQPIDVCVDTEKDFLLVADYANNRVQVLNKETGEFIRSIGSTEGENAMNGPRALCLNRETALLFISDRENNRIQMFDKNSFTLIRHIGLGYGISPGMFNRPMELCVDNEEGVLIVVDGHNHRVQIIDLPELQKEKFRIKSSKLNAGELIKENISATPSAIAVSILGHREYFELKYSAANVVFLKIPICGDHIVCSLTSSFYEDNFDYVPAQLRGPEATKNFSPILTGIPNNRDSPLFGQAKTFLQILDEVSKSTNLMDSSDAFLFAPSLLALYSLIQRGWIPSVCDSQIIKRLVSLMSHLHKGATLPSERQSILFASVELIRVYLQHSSTDVDDIFSSFLQFFDYSYDVEGYLENSQPLSDGLIADISVNKLNDPLPASILYAITYLSVLSIQSFDSWMNSTIATGNSSREVTIEGLTSSECKEIVAIMLGSTSTDTIFSIAKKRKQSAKLSGKIISGNPENVVVHIPQSFSNILKSTLVWKQYQRKIYLKQIHDPTTASSFRQSMLLTFAEHIDEIHKINSICSHNKENRSRGGRNIWNPLEPLCPGDLVDCMDKEKSWFESVVVEVGIDGSVRIHFLGWGSKWDDTISEEERSLRIAPLNTHTKNWRSDLFEGGLIEIKCNDDMVNQKWMWGRITQLNVEESWVEVAYAFSNEPVVLKKAWLFGETICPVGMHTKDKSKAAAALITRPGKTVKEILAEKVSLGRSDIAFYDIFEEVQDSTKMNSIPSLQSLLISESFHGKFGMNSANGIYYLPLAAKYLFQCALEGVSSIVAEIVGSFVVNHSVSVPFFNSVITQLLPVKRVVESLARTSLRDSLPKYYVNILYIQAGLAAQSIAYPLKQLSLETANDTAVIQVLDLADRLMQLHELFNRICDETLTTLVCSPSTKTYIVDKLQVTINRCGFTPIANDLLTAISNNSSKANSFFLPFKQNAVVYPHMKRHRNFFRCLVSSGSKHEVDKLYKVMEEEIVHSSLSNIASPLSLWKKGCNGSRGNAQSLTPVKYLSDVITACEGVKSLLDSGWINFEHLLLSPERFLMQNMGKFSAAESLSMGKCLAIAVNSLMGNQQKLSSSEQQYSPSAAAGLLKKIVSLVLTLGYDEIIFYFRQYFGPELFFRIIRGEFSSLVEERFMWKDIGAVADIAEGIFNQMELFEKLNNEFSKYLLLKLDDDDSPEEYSESPMSSEVIDANDLLMNTISEKALRIHLFKDSQIPARVLQDSFSSIRLPKAMRQLIHYFATFCHGHGIENSSRIRWCYGFGKMEVTCSVWHRACFTLIVNELQLALLSCLASYCTSEEPRLSLGRLAFELNITVEAVIHIVSSIIVDHDSSDNQIPSIIRIYDGDNDSHVSSQLTENTVVTLAWTGWLKQNFPLTESSFLTGQCTYAYRTQEVNLYERFWSCNKHTWTPNSNWRSSILEASILRQLKNVMIHAVAPGAKETLNEIELATNVVKELSGRFPGQLFHDDEVISSAKALRKKGMISSSLGVSFSSNLSHELRYSFFVDCDKKAEQSRYLLSRRSNARPNVTPIAFDVVDTVAVSSHPISSATNIIKNDDEITRPVVSTTSDEASECESKYCSSSPHQLNESFSSPKYDSIGNSVSGVSINSMVIQNFITRCFANISLDDGSLVSRKELTMRECLLTLMDTVVIACGSVITELNGVLYQSTVKQKDIFPNFRETNFCVDFCLSELFNGVFSPLVPSELPIYQACLLPLAAGLKREALELLLNEFSRIVVSDSILADIVSKLTTQFYQQSESSSFSLSFSLLKKIWNREYALDLRRLFSVPASRWKTFILQQFGITQDHLQREENAFKSHLSCKEDCETAEKKDNEIFDNMCDSFNSTSSLPALTSSKRPKADSPIFQLSFLSFFSKFLVFISSEHLPSNSLLLDRNKVTAGVSQTSVRVKNTTSNQKEALTLNNGTINKKKASKFLAEMGPAIDRLPQLAQSNPSSFSVSSFTGNSDDEEGKDSSPSAPLPLSLPKFPESSTRKGIVPPVPPVQRSWIEDPIVRYSQLDLENKFSKNSSKSEFGRDQDIDDNNPEYLEGSNPSTTLLVDLSDAIPNYSWTTPTKSPSSRSIAQQNQNQIWNHVISPIVALVSAHANLIFSNRDTSSYSSSKMRKEYSPNSNNVQIGVALMDALLSDVLAKSTTSFGHTDNENHPHHSILWWMKRPFLSIFQVIEEGLALASALRELSTTVVNSNINYANQIQHHPEWSLSSLSASCATVDEKFENIAFTQTFPVGYCCNNEAWDSLVTLQILDVSDSLVNIISQVSKVLCIHWSTAVVLLSKFDWEPQNVLENYPFENENEVMSLYESVKAFSGSVSHPPIIMKNLGDFSFTCFSCGNSTLQEDMFSLGCHHIACRGCWWKFIDQKLSEIETLESSSAVDIKSLLIPCQRTSCSSINCKFVGGLELLYAITKNDCFKRSRPSNESPCNSYLSILWKAAARDFAEKQQRKTKIYPSVACAHYAPISDRDTLQCILCDGWQASSVSSHVEDRKYKQGMDTSRPNLNTKYFSFRNQRNQFSSAHANARKLADIATMPMLSHSSHLRRIENNLGVLQKQLSVCSDLKLFHIFLRRIRFWRLFWDCQLLLDHNQSMSVVDLELLRYVKDLLYKQAAKVGDESDPTTAVCKKGVQQYEVLEKPKEVVSDVTEDTLLLMSHWRKKLKQLHDFPDVCTSRLVLAPAGKANSMFDVYQSPKASSVLQSTSNSSSRNKSKVRYNGDAFPWPVRMVAKESRSIEDKRNLESGNLVVDEASTPIATTEGDVNQYVSLSIPKTAGHSQGNSLMFAVELDSLHQLFATVDNVTLRFHLSKLLESIDGSPLNDVDSCGRMTQDNQEEENNKQRQWRQLVDLVQYPRHDAVSLNLTLHILTLFIELQTQQVQIQLKKADHAIDYFFPITEELLGCFYDLLQQHQRVIIHSPHVGKNEASQSELYNEDHGENLHSPWMNLSYEQSAQLVRQCGLFLCAITSSSSIFRLQLSSIEPASLLLDTCVQLLYLEHHVDELYCAIGHIAIAVLDLVLHVQSFNCNVVSSEPILNLPDANVLSARVVERNVGPNRTASNEGIDSTDNNNKIPLTDLHVVDLVDAMVSRYDDLQVLEGARRERRFLEDNDYIAIESNEEVYYSEIYHLGDLLCAVLLRILSVPLDHKHNHHAMKRDGSPQTKSTNHINSEMMEAIYALPGVFSLLFSNLQHYTKLHVHDSSSSISTHFIDMFDKSTDNFYLNMCNMNPCNNHNEHGPTGMKLCHLLHVTCQLLVLADVNRLLTVMNPLSDTLALVLRDLCQYFLRPSVRSGNHLEDSSETAIHPYIPAMVKSGELNLFVVTMQCISAFAETSELFRRCLLKHDLSYLLLYLQTAWASLHRSHHVPDQSRDTIVSTTENDEDVALKAQESQRQEALSQLQRAIAVVCEGGGLLTTASATSGPGASRHVRESVSPATTMHRHGQRPGQTALFFNGQEADHGDMNVHPHRQQQHQPPQRHRNEGEMDILTGLVQRFESFLAQDHDVMHRRGTATMMEPLPVVERLVMDRDMFNLDDILARIAEQEAREDEDEESDMDTGEMEEGFDEEENEEDLEFNMALWQQHFREHFMHHDQHQRLFDPNGAFDEEGDEDDDATVADELHDETEDDEDNVEDADEGDEFGDSDFEDDEEEEDEGSLDL